MKESFPVSNYFRPRTLLIVIVSLLLLLMSNAVGLSSRSVHAQALALLTPKHVLIVVEENKDYNQIYPSQYAPYINNTLIAKGSADHQLSRRE